MNTSKMLTAVKNSKFEYRNPKQYQMIKIQTTEKNEQIRRDIPPPMFGTFEHSNLGFVSYFGIRISNF